MILKISKYATAALVVLMTAAAVPEIIDTVFRQNSPWPFASYSHTAKKFLVRVRDDSSNTKTTDDRMSYTTEDGKKLGKIQYMKMLPFENSDDLAKWNRLPREIDGSPISLEIIKANRQSFKIMPFYINAPQIDIYPMFESESRYARLEYGPHMFRITDSILFIELKTNTVDSEKSVVFTEAMKKAGFTFPAKRIAGNPTTRKAFDEGYFVVDSADRLFHVKQVKSQPWVRDTGVVFGKKVITMSMMEDLRREFYGYVVTEDLKVSLISYDNYRLIQLPVGNYDPRESHLLFAADPLGRTIRIWDDERIRTVYVDRDYRLVKEHETVREKVNEGLERVVSFLLPFRIDTEDSSTQYVAINFKHSGAASLPLCAAAAILYVFYILKRRMGLRGYLADILLVLITGIYGLFALIVTGPFGRKDEKASKTDGSSCRGENSENCGRCRA